MKWECSAGAQAPQDHTKHNPLLARVNKTTAMEMSCPKRRLENQLIQRERTRRVSGAGLAQHQWHVGPWTYRQIELITVDKAEESLQIQTITLV